MKPFVSIASLAFLVALLMSGCGNPSARSQPGNTRQATVQTPRSPVATGTIQAPAGCPISPIHTEPFSGPGSNSDPVGLPWVQAEPAAAGITAFLFYASSDGPFLHTGGHFPNGVNDKILWVIEHPQATNQIEIKGILLSNPQQTFNSVFPAALSPADQYPSIIGVAVPGCWQFMLTSGPVSGIMIFWVIDN